MLSKLLVKTCELARHEPETVTYLAPGDKGVGHTWYF